ncbi:thioredoxin [Coraliomargarita akajimensis]|uniref:Thioredoxin n=1 Tax=Coraliomargarita akajimensis (strain DSM 45221 / IAM 15411 / JCM 23193 / KCTC 12865 / 04OKA010-24) TaxID=583355 RepID=D5EPL0_CORAD|nr:thioredoxin [Coraliomargarita akajimensis]ADE53747.1 thioredoxin [Coraliomargarita akajimensis DSM 45221]
MSSEVLHISSEAAYKQLVQSGQPLLVDFWAPWCGPCRALGPVLDEAARESGESAIIAKVNVDELPALAREHGITSIPALLYFADGKLQERATGVQSKEAILSQLASLDGIGA